uniref:Uncharacterized protein n=1 Tax=Ciona intestinalis TaxID=7719 RepID=F6XPM3_CIOIN
MLISRYRITLQGYLCVNLILAVVVCVCNTAVLVISLHSYNNPYKYCDSFVCDVEYLSKHYIRFVQPISCKVEDLGQDDELSHAGFQIQTSLFNLVTITVQHQFGLVAIKLSFSCFQTY